MKTLPPLFNLSLVLLGLLTISMAKPLPPVASPNLTQVSLLMNTSIPNPLAKTLAVNGPVQSIGQTPSTTAHPAQPTKRSHTATQQPTRVRVRPAETVRFQNGDTITLQLSNQNANRLLLPRDTIAGVVCPPFRCHATLPAQDTSHSVYLTIPATVTKPFTVHVSTLAHRYFSAWVIPKNRPGVTVLLEPTSPGWTKKTGPHHSEPWVGQVSDLVGAMWRQQPPEDDAAVTFPKAKAVPLTPQFTAKKTLAYRGERFTVTRYTLINRTKQWVRVSEPEFYHAGTVAVALSRQMLPPHGHIILYQVTTTGGPT